MSNSFVALICSDSVAANARAASTCLVFMRTTNGRLLLDHYSRELFDYWEITKAEFEWIQFHQLLLWALLLLSLLPSFLKLNIDCRWYKWELLCWNHIIVLTFIDAHHTWLDMRVSNNGLWLHGNGCHGKTRNFDYVVVHINFLVVSLLLSPDTTLRCLWEAEISL